jgi:hypothetical protein
MGYHNKLPESLQEVDVIIAGGRLSATLNSPFPIFTFSQVV